MATTFEKLNLKDRKEIAVLGAPASFEPELASLVGVTAYRELTSLTHVDFVLAFVTAQADLDTIAARVIERMKGDAVVWFAYPKGTSKKLKCDFNRDRGWDLLFSAGFDTVRAVGIDEDWSAIRFRRVAYIKNSIRRP